MLDIDRTAPDAEELLTTSSFLGSVFAGIIAGVASALCAWQADLGVLVILSTYCFVGSTAMIAATSYRPVLAVWDRHS